MATYTFTFGTTEATPGDFSDVLTAAKLQIGTGPAIALGTLVPAATYDAVTKVVTVPNYGTYDFNTNTFKAAQGLAGTLVVTKGTSVTPAIIDLSAATGDLTFVAADAGITKILGGAGADVLTGGAGTTSIDGGAGNDTLTSNLATTALTGGTGADQFVQVAGAKKLLVTDYKYAENDKVVLDTLVGAMTAETLSAGGVFTSATAVSSVTVSGTAADGAYKINVTGEYGTDTVASTKEFWTAKTATSAITLDGSAKSDKLVIDVTNATNAVVTGGINNDTILLNGSQVTLNAGVNGGSDTINNFDAGFTGDVLNLNGYTLNDVKWGNAAGGTATIGSTTTLTGGGFGAAVGTPEKILVQENGGTVKKVVYAANNNEALAVADADVYMVTGAGNFGTLNASGVVTDGVVINFQDTDKYRNLKGMTGAANATGYYIGNTTNTTSATAGTSFDLTGSAKASEVWGGSKFTDTINLRGVNGAQDIVYFGATDGLDSVTGFKSGFAATADVVNLYDVADVSKLTFGAGTSATNGVSIKAATNNVLDLTAVDAVNVTNSVQLKLKNSAGTVKKVAAAVLATGSTIDGTDAELVIGQENTAGRDQVKYASSTANLVVNLLDTSIYKSIENVDLTGVTGSYNVVVGSGSAASDITLAGATTEVWGGSKDGDSITAGSGTDTIWYGASDGKDTVSGFVAGTDKIKFYDKSVAAVAATYTWDGAGIFGSTTKAADTLTFTNTVVTNKTIDILDKDNKAGKVALSNAGGVLTYVKGTDIYMGTGANQLTVNGSENVALYLGNGVDATVNDIYFSGVTAINAAAATGETVLIGSATGKDVLTAGKTTSAMWGGGSAADTMDGGVGTDQYWFGAGDGADKVTKGVDKKDTVVLYNATSVADVTMTVDAAAGTFSITAADGSKLSLTDANSVAAMDAGLTFQFGVNEGAKSYTYDRIAKNFIAK